MEDGAKFCPSCGTPVGGAAPAPKPAAEKVGNIRKCPACGAEVPSMTAVCPSCGHEFSNIQVANSVQMFFEKLDALDSEVFEQDAAKEAKGPLGGAVGAMLGLNEMANRFSGPNAGEKRKIALIEGFPIPNSKEDLLEFLILATSRIKPIPKMMGFGAIAAPSEINSVKRMNEAWASKCQQVYNKAKIVLGTDKDAVVQITATLDTIDAKKCGIKFNK
jgi:hypothetical protein